MHAVPKRSKLVSVRTYLRRYGCARMHPRRSEKRARRNQRVRSMTDTRLRPGINCKRVSSRQRVRNSICRNLHCRDNIHYYITSLRNRRLRFYRTGLVRVHRARPANSTNRSGSVGFANARIPPIALADMLAAPGFPGIRAS